MPHGEGRETDESIEGAGIDGKRSARLRDHLDLSLMAARSSSRCLPPGALEFAVDRQTITQFFSRPIGRTTFYDLVAKGVILPLKGLRGFYLLNESLVRLGLRPVPALPAKQTRSRGDLLRWAFWMLDPLLFSRPGWVMNSHRQTDDEWISALLAQVHGPRLNALGSVEEKLAYAEGAVQAQIEIPGPPPT